MSRTMTTTISLAGCHGLPQRSVKRAVVVSPEHGAVEGVMIDPAELDRLANWACRWNLFHFHDEETESLRYELVDAGGSCDKCFRDAAILLSECPYIDMSHSPIMRVR